MRISQYDILFEVLCAQKLTESGVSGIGAYLKKTGRTDLYSPFCEHSFTALEVKQP